MASTSESGHAKNVTNLETLITAITAFGTSYNPSRGNLKLTTLQTLLTATKESFNQVNTTQSSYSIAVDAREVTFSSFGKLVTRISNALKASDITTQVDESAQTIIRKLRGKRAGTKLTDEEKATLQAEGKEVTQISVSQMGYDSRLDNFEKLITLLSTVSEYSPNEEELKVESLQAVYNDLKTKNTDVITNYIQLDNARNSRNDVLYKESTGLVDIASDSKTYIKSVFGATSPQYKQISKLTFIKRE
ncbi:MAG: hypothetical protein PHH37_14950 [Paludibacter sp.]|nr:hypothetical protein [Paludibacter sp.]